jgi:hypothetical protein
VAQQPEQPNEQVAGPSPDRLNAQVGVLTRREIEARILAPVIEALAATYGREGVLATVRDAIIEIARAQGRDLVETMGGDSLRHFAESLQFWTRDQALEIDVKTQTEDEFRFNVTRCRYAELYRALGVADLGAILSCNRDAALIEGFNAEFTLERTQTIMGGAPCCDFNYIRQRRADSTGAGAV